MVTLRECTCRRGWTPSPDWPGYNRRGSQALFFFFPFLLPSEIFVGAVQRVAQPGVGRSRVF